MCMISNHVLKPLHDDVNDDDGDKYTLCVLVIYCYCHAMASTSDNLLNTLEYTAFPYDFLAKIEL